MSFLFLFRLRSIAVGFVKACCKYRCIIRKSVNLSVIFI